MMGKNQDLKKTGKNSYQLIFPDEKDVYKRSKTNYTKVQKAASAEGIAGLLLCGALGLFGCTLSNKIHPPMTPHEKKILSLPSRELQLYLVGHQSLSFDKYTRKEVRDNCRKALSDLSYQIYKGDKKEDRIIAHKKRYFRNEYMGGSSGSYPPNQPITENDYYVILSFSENKEKAVLECKVAKESSWASNSVGKRYLKQFLKVLDKNLMWRKKRPIESLRWLP